MNERHHLVLCLGTGPLQNPDAPIRERRYSPTTYYRPDRPEATAETPFVGEAILKLYPQRFTDVHLFGTADSMWHTLYTHLLQTGDDFSEEEIEADTRLYRAVEERSLGADDAPLRVLEARFEQQHGVRCTCRIVPLPPPTMHSGSRCASWRGQASGGGVRPST